MKPKPTARLIEAARGDRPVDLLLHNARLVNVFLGAVIETDIAISDGFIVGFGPYDALQTVDLQGRYVAPGFIDAHVHIESALVGPAEFARAVLPRGTTAVVADPHEIANVLGTAGIDYMLAASEGLPVRFYFTLPSCVPATHMESAGARLTEAILRPYLAHPRIVGLAEMMNFPGVIHADGEVLAKIAAMQAAGKPVDGHAPGLGGRALHAYLGAGIASDHECTSVREAEEKLAAGMHIMVREGTGAKNLDDLLPLITSRTARRMLWCSDDRHAHDLLAEGHIGQMVRRAVRGGVDPIVAIQMATLNPAEYFRLDEVGAVAPGRRADLVVLDDLNDPVVRQVYSNGRLVAEAGRLVDNGKAAQPPAAPGAMKVPLERIDFKIAARGRRVRVIETVPQQIVTRGTVADARIIDGLAVADPKRDLLKIAVVERHQGSGRTGIGFIRGFGLTRGALAATVAHDSHNIVVVGATDGDMHAAVAALVAMVGGLVAVEAGQVTAQLALPIAGLMSDQPMATVCAGLDGLLAAARHMGSMLPDPFMTLSFMALPVIPALKITDMGLVDVAAFNIVPLFLDEQ
ncbi:MAG: adenine deaminase [Desulfobacterales bacterium]|nr:adenine deaminase [Desulfobacterales bacterium]